MSTPSSGLTRRGALAGAFMLSGLAAGTALGGDGAMRPDDALHHASTVFWDCEARLEALEHVPDGPFGSEVNQRHEAQRDALTAKQEAALARLASIPAQTHSALSLKAVIVERILPREVDSFDLDSNSAPIRLSVSLARDVRALR
ncbi:hypothetical protein HW509_07540 [Asaia spathodeae]|uniref:hypothetical protein n=1 Tax=Asaia spathodeae TaxID=657016 RepID=UPI002FC31868